jgi:hypothetical protein
MGTSFSVTYATIFMIWLESCVETPIINEFQRQIVLYESPADYAGSNSIRDQKGLKEFQDAVTGLRAQWAPSYSGAIHWG